MPIPWRGLRLAFVAAALAPVLVLAGPARPAAAYHDGGSGLTDYSRPVGVPSTVLSGSLDDATAAERARLVGNTIPRGGTISLPTSGPKTYEKGVSAFTKGLGLLTVPSVGFELTNMTMRLFGVPEDLIGIDALVDGLHPPQLDPSYVVNGDWTPSGSSGWSPSNILTLNGAQARFELIPEDITWTGSRHAEVHSYEFWQDTLVAAGQEGVSWRITYKCLDPVDGLLYDGASVSSSMASTGTMPNLMRSVTNVVDTCHAGRTFDSIVVRLYPGTNVAGGVESTYYPLGHASRPAAVSDPERMWKVRTRCLVAGAPEWADSYSDTFRETDEVLPPYPEAACSAGTLEAVELWQVAPGNPELDVLLDSWEIDPDGSVVRDWVNGPKGDLELFTVGPDGWPDLSCLDNPELCLDWWVDPDRATKYRCTYAGQPVALDECAVYAPTPNALAGRDLLTRDGKRVPAGTYYPHADPATGLHVPGDPEPGSEPTTPEETEPGSRDCAGPPTFIETLSPSWHWSNMKCLFIPDLEYMPETQALVDTALSKPPVSWVTGIANLWPAEGALPVGGGICPDWRIKLPMVNYNENIICDSTYTWAIVGGRTFILGFMVVTAFAPLVRSIWYSILPFVRPVPTGGIHGG